MKILTLKEAALYLKITQRELKELIKSNEIPAFRINKSYRVAKTVLDEFVSKNINDQGEYVFEPSYYILNGGLIDGIDVKNKKELIEVLVEITSLHNDIDEKNRNEYKKLLEQREEMSSTGIGKGVALMHTKRIYKKIRKPFIVFIRLNSSIDFESMDNEKVDLVFLIGMKNEKTHLKILSIMCRLFHENPVLIEKLRKSPRNELLDIICFEEEKVLGKLNNE